MQHFSTSAPAPPRGVVTAEEEAAKLSGTDESARWRSMYKRQGPTHTTTPKAAAAQSSACRRCPMRANQMTPQERRSTADE
eukprot:1401456-Heterocapsa_arctica.AAC.1